MARAERTLESLNRETARARQLLDACLSLVRSALHENHRDQALEQAMACRRLVPDLALGGKNVRVLFGELELVSADREWFDRTPEGGVFQYPSSRCMKFFTDLDLAFGETRIAAGNLAPGYPGVYGLWLKKTAGGWRLVFNEEGDVWGTMHDPAKDVAEVPLERLWHAVPAFPTVSEVWLRLLEAYGL